MAGRRGGAKPIDYLRLPEYIGRPIWIDYGDELQHRWLKSIEPFGNDSAAVVERGSGPWMGEYGWGWLAWEKKPSAQERAAHPLGAKLGLCCPGLPEWMLRTKKGACDGAG